MDTKLIYKLNPAICKYCCKGMWVYGDHGISSEHVFFRCEFDKESYAEIPCSIVDEFICPLAKKGGTL